MTEELDIFEIIDQLAKKLRTDDEKEALTIVGLIFFNHLDDDLSVVDNLFENFLTKFNKLKGQVKNTPQRIELKIENERDANLRKLIVELMLADQNITNFDRCLSEKHFVVPTGYDAARIVFLKYRPVVFKVGRKIINSSSQKVKNFANDSDIKIPAWFFDALDMEKFFGFAPDFSCIYDDLENKMTMYENDPKSREPYEQALMSLEFLEVKVIGSSLSTLCKRWYDVPTLLIPRHVAVKNPMPLRKLYDEAVRTQVSGNYVACIAMCRSLIEHVLIKYYGANAVGSLDEKITWAEKRYESLLELRLHEKRREANDLIHEYAGKNVEGKVTLRFIETVKALVERIPVEKLI